LRINVKGAVLMNPHLLLAPLSPRTHEERVLASRNGNGAIVSRSPRGALSSHLAFGAPWQHTLVLRGELDHDSTGELDEELTCLCEEGVTSVLLDLRERRLIDSQGARAIATGGALCRRRGCEVGVISDSLDVARVLSRAGAGEMLAARRDEEAGPPPSASGASEALRTTTVKEL